MLSVQDYGPGIPRQYHEDIFKMFFRAHDSTSGTGLGLYIVKQTLDKLHGHIELVSEVNRGTTFRVTVPNNYDEHKLPA